MNILNIFLVKYFEAGSLITIPPLSFSETLQPIFLPQAAPVEITGLMVQYCSHVLKPALFSSQSKPLSELQTTHLTIQPVI